MEHIDNLVEIDNRHDNGGNPDNLEMPSLIRPLELSVDKLLHIVKKVSESDWAMSDEEFKLDEYDRALGLLRSAHVIFEIGDFQGVLLITDMFIGLRAEVSVIIWDRKGLGLARAEGPKDVMKWLMQTFQLQRLEAKVPVTNTLALAYDKKIGFVEEGTLRNYIQRGGKWEDVRQLSLLRREVGLE